MFGLLSWYPSQQMLHALSLRKFVYTRGKAYTSTKSPVASGTVVTRMARALALLLRQGMSAIELLQEQNIRHNDIIHSNVVVVPAKGRPLAQFQIILLDFCRAEWEHPNTPFHRSMLTQTAGSDEHFDLYSLACTLIDRCALALAHAHPRHPPLHARPRFRVEPLKFSYTCGILIIPTGSGSGTGNCCSPRYRVVVAYFHTNPHEEVAESTGFTHFL